MRWIECPWHKGYTATREPGGECPACWDLYQTKQRFEGFKRRRNQAKKKARATR